MGLCSFLALVAVAIPLHAHAVLAGDPQGKPPDWPALRIDPNSKLSPYAGVGALLVRGAVYTAVLIDGTHALTAAHVVAGVARGQIMFVLNFGRDRSQRLHAETVFVHPDYLPGKSNEPSEHDLAIVKLAVAAEADVPRYPILRTPLPFGQLVSLCGYGASGDGNRGVFIDPEMSVKRIGANRLDQFLFSQADRERRIGYLFDFDGPTLATNVIGARTPANGTIGNRSESTVATGDSGSAVFVRDLRGRLIVAGINTFIAPMPGRAQGTFGSLAGGMLVSPYWPWIEEVLKRD